jgi:Raf kinase inhibitor-like YbhB/YbcL family protein
MRKLVSLLLFMAFLVCVMSGCGPGPTPAPEAPTPTPAAAPSAPPEKEGPTVPFELTSTAFAPGEPIPGRYSCDGEDISPPLQWSDPPQGTQSLALICDDPDAPIGTWVHWVLFNLPAEVRSLPEAVPSEAERPDSSRHGENGWGRLDYGGPCPPSGTHRYVFKLYVLDTVLDLEAGAGKKQVLQAMEGHILAEAELLGVYSRQ